MSPYDDANEEDFQSNSIIQIEGFGGPKTQANLVETRQMASPSAIDS